MAILMQLRWPGMTAAQYDKVCKQVNWENEKPEGALFHVAAADAQGLRVVDLWASAELFNRFVEQRLMPGIQAVGVTGQPDVEITPVHATFVPGPLT
jgi:hypothetical protein